MIVNDIVTYTSLTIADIATIIDDDAKTVYVASYRDDSNTSIVNKKVSDAIPVIQKSIADTVEYLSNPSVDIPHYPDNIIPVLSSIYHTALSIVWAMGKQCDSTEKKYHDGMCQQQKG